MSPISGLMSDKLNPKIPAAIGLVLLGFGLILNYYLSLYSTNMQITGPLVLRGLAMGMIFAPLSTLAVAQIPREKLAQASGLFNVIRQLGGSFGVAVLGTLLSRQTIIHVANFGQAVDTNSPAFQKALLALRFSIQHGAGFSMGNAAAASKSALLQNLSSQAFVQAICDDFMIAGLATLACIVPLLLLKYTKRPHPLAPSPQAERGNAGGEM